MTKQRPAATPELSAGDKILRALRPCMRWSGSKDELLDCVFWLRQLLSVVVGIALGLLGITGYIGFLVYIATTTLACILYARLYLGGADVLEGNDALSEGFLGSIGFFFTSWVLSYSFSH